MSNNCQPFWAKHKGDSVSVFMKGFEKLGKEMVLYTKPSTGLCEKNNEIRVFSEDGCIAIPDGVSSYQSDVEQSDFDVDKPFTSGTLSTSRSGTRRRSALRSLVLEVAG